MDRRELIAKFVKELLDGNKEKARKMLKKFIHHHSKEILKD